MGLKPFSFNDAHLFFGRERHIDAVRSKLSQFHFVSIIGNSGSGKSSFIRAGLLPSLINEQWKVFTMRPGNNPVHRLAEAISSNENDIEKNTSVLRKNKRGIYQIIREQGHENKNLILVDQFEEVFRFKATNEHLEYDAQVFIELLLNAIKDVDSPIYVALTLRSEFVGMCEQFSGLPEAMNNGQFLIPRMTAEELRQSITEPIKLTGAKITHRLLYRLEQETHKKPDLLPVMQHALMRTYDYWMAHGNNDSIDIEHYEATGGIKNALSNHANEVYNGLNKKEKALCAAIFKILGYRNDEGLSIRRPTEVKVIAAICNATTDEVKSAIAPFRKKDTAFVVPNESITLNENSILDIAHESLIRNWDRYKTWIREEATAVEIYIRLTESAILYRENKAGLYRQPELKQALEWKEKAMPNEAWANQYNAEFLLTIDFLALSKQDYEFERINKSRVRKFSIAALVAVIIILSILSVWAITQRNTAQKNATLLEAEKIEAEKQKKLAEEAKAEAEDNLEKAVAEEKRANEQLEITETERNRANLNARLAQEKTAEAIKSQQRAENARQLALMREKEAKEQKTISDSLYIKADSAQKAAKKLQMLAISKNLAISSQIIQPTDEAKKREKALMALYAIRINESYNNGKFDAELFKALNDAYHSVELQEKWNITGHNDEVRSTAIMRAKNAVVSVGINGRVLINDLNTGKQHAVFQIPNAELISKVLIDDNERKLIFIGSESVYMYDLNNYDKPELVKKQLHDYRIVDAIMFNNVLFTADAVGNLRSFDVADAYSSVESYQVLFKLKGICSYNDSSILLATEQKEVLLWDFKNNKVVSSLVKVKSDITCLAYDYQSYKMAIGCSNGTAYLFENGELIEYTGHTAAISSITLSLYGNLMATGSFDSKVLFWNLSNNSSTPTEFDMHSSFVHSVRLGNDALVSAGKDRNIFIVNLDQKGIYTELKAKYPNGFSKNEWQKLVGEETDFVEL